MRSRLTTDSCRTMAALLVDEGGRIVECTHRKNHLHVVYTFDGTKKFITQITRHKSAGDPRAMKNFRAEIRRNKRATP